MRLRSPLFALSAALGLFLSGCVDFQALAGSVCDAGRCGEAPGSTPDGGASDAGRADAGAGADSGVTDSGVVDSGVTDAGRTDAGSPDSGTSDSGVPDAGLWISEVLVNQSSTSREVRQGDYISVEIRGHGFFAPFPNLEALGLTVPVETDVSSPPTMVRYFLTVPTTVGLGEKPIHLAPGPNLDAGVLVVTPFVVDPSSSTIATRRGTYDAPFLTVDDALFALGGVTTPGAVLELSGDVHHFGGLLAATGAPLGSTEGLPAGMTVRSDGGILLFDAGIASSAIALAFVGPATLRGFTIQHFSAAVFAKGPGPLRLEGMKLLHNEKSISVVDAGEVIFDGGFILNQGTPLRMSGDAGVTIARSLVIGELGRVATVEGDSLLTLLDSRIECRGINPGGCITVQSPLRRGATVIAEGSTIDSRHAAFFTGGANDGGTFNGLYSFEGSTIICRGGGPDVCITNGNGRAVLDGGAVILAYDAGDGPGFSVRLVGMEAVPPSLVVHGTSLHAFEGGYCVDDNRRQDAGSLSRAVISTTAKCNDAGFPAPTAPCTQAPAYRTGQPTRCYVNQ